MPDALLPAEIAQKAEEIGVRKAAMPAGRLFVLGGLAGAFIALGGLASTISLVGTAGTVPWGWARVVAGLVFSMGLGLVLVGGAELFTGNNLIIMAWAHGKVGTAALLRNWAIVFVGNAAGAVATALLVHLSGVSHLAEGAVGALMVSGAVAKCALSPVEAFVRGVLCNALVCLAVWLSYSARSTADRILAITLPITAFVAAGLEHSIANLYFLPLGALAQSADGPITLGPALANLLLVTLGNVVGGAGLVGLVYYLVYLREGR